MSAVPSLVTGRGVCGAPFWPTISRLMHCREPACPQRLPGRRLGTKPSGNREQPGFDEKRLISNEWIDETTHAPGRPTGKVGV